MRYKRHVWEVTKERLAFLLLEKCQQLISYYCRNTLQKIQDALRRQGTALIDLAGDRVNFGRTLAQKLRGATEYRKQIKIAKVVGSGLALSGSVLWAVAAVASPATLPLAGVCMTIHGAGRLIYTWASLADIIVNELIPLVDSDEDLIAKLVTIIKSIKDLRSLPNMSTRSITFLEGGIKMAKGDTGSLKFGLKETIIKILAGAPMTDEFKKLIEAASKNVDEKLFFLNIAMIPINIIQFCKALEDLREGEKSTFCKGCLLLADFAESGIEYWIKCNEKHWDGEGSIPPSQESKNENPKPDEKQNENKSEKENEKKINHPNENDNKNHIKTNLVGSAAEYWIESNEQHWDGEGSIPPSQESKNENPKPDKKQNENKSEKKNEKKINHPNENNKNHIKMSREKENTNGSKNENKNENKIESNTKNKSKHEHKMKSENHGKNENDLTHVRSKMRPLKRTRAKQNKRECQREIMIGVKRDVIIANVTRRRSSTTVSKQVIFMYHSEILSTY